jgi:hypothetical protein
MKKSILFVTLVIVSILIGCSPANATAPIPSKTPINTIAPTMTVTPSPSFTPTKRATPTKRPTETPAPKPIIYSGHGDTVLDLDDDLIGEPRTADISHTGSSNFAIISYGSDSERLDLLVNTIGDYQGRIPIDFYNNEVATRLEIKADGDWKIKFSPLDCAYQTCIQLPKNYQGKGDEVLLFPWSYPDVVTIDATGSSNFAVIGLSDEGRDLLVNDIAPYSGQVMFSGNTYIAIIKATGDWTMDITKK